MLENNKNEYGITRRPGTAARLWDGLLYFGVGATVGATLALLFAPKPGSELRCDIADVTRKGYDATLEKAMDLKNQSTEAVQAVKDRASAVYDFGSEKLKKGSDAVSDFVSATTGAVKDGIDQMEHEAGISTATRNSGKRPSNIM